ncbi:MAG TPA: hypothetical protein VGP73_08625 [Thermoanaerobaculia bacterium]
MKKLVLVLLALLALTPFAKAMAQAPTTAPAPAIDAATAQFLATLAGGQTQAPSDLTPAPLFKSGCSSSADCPKGQLCCNLCGTSPDGNPCLSCTKPLNGHCPLVG